MKPSAPPEGLTALLDEALALKAVPRTGWVRQDIPAPESVAAHSWGVAWLGLAHCAPGLDRERVLAMAIVHDLAEVRVGDWTPDDPRGTAAKHSAEREAARELLALRPDLLALWQEYEDQATPEARFVRELDRLDMALQARHYARRTGKDLEEFVTSALAVITTPALRAHLMAQSLPQAIVK